MDWREGEYILIVRGRILKCFNTLYLMCIREVNGFMKRYDDPTPTFN